MSIKCRNQAYSQKNTCTHPKKKRSLKTFNQLSFHTYSRQEVEDWYFYVCDDDDEPKGKIKKIWVKKRRRKYFKSNILW